MRQFLKVRPVLGLHHLEGLDVGRQVATVEGTGPVTRLHNHRLIDRAKHGDCAVLLLDPFNGLRQGLENLSGLILTQLLVNHFDQTDSLYAQVDQLHAHMEAVSASPLLPILKLVSLTDCVDVLVVVGASLVRTLHQPVVLLLLFLPRLSKAKLILNRSAQGHGHELKSAEGGDTSQHILEGQK